MLCLCRQSAELAPSRSSENESSRFTRALGEAAPWLASCMTQKPTPATASPMLTLRSAASHGPGSANISKAQESTSQESIAVIFTAMGQPPWRARADDSKYSSTRRTRSAWNEPPALKRTFGDAEL